MLRQNRRWAPVVDNAGYVGLIAVTNISKFPIADWLSLAERMRTSHTDAIAVTTDNNVIGVVTLRDLTSVEVLLDRLENETS